MPRFIIERTITGMRLGTVIATCTIAVGVALGAGTPSASAEVCGSTCSGVGAAGTGGQSSDGKAEGWRFQQPSTTFPGSTYTNAGNEIGGNITYQGSASGMGAGAFTPQGVVVGHFDGVVAGLFGIDGTCNGVCG
jgi:hypothetical protein